MKRVIEFLLLSVIPICLAILLPNYFKFYRGTIELPGLFEFATWFLFFFILIAGLFYSIKPLQKLASVPDGYQKLYNKQNQIAKKGIFKGGKLIDGSKYIYNKDGLLSGVEIFKNGVYINSPAET